MSKSEGDGRQVARPEVKPVLLKQVVNVLENAADAAGLVVRAVAVIREVAARGFKNGLREELESRARAVESERRRLRQEDLD